MSMDDWLPRSSITPIHSSNFIENHSQIIPLPETSSRKHKQKSTTQKTTSNQLKAPTITLRTSLIPPNATTSYRNLNKQKDCRKLTSEANQKCWWRRHLIKGIAAAGTKHNQSPATYTIGQTLAREAEDGDLKRYGLRWMGKSGSQRWKGIDGGGNGKKGKEGRWVSDDKAQWRRRKHRTRNRVEGDGDAGSWMGGGQKTRPEEEAGERWNKDDGGSGSFAIWIASPIKGQERGGCAK